MSVPTDIAIAYLIQGSFYGHSIYATLYMDAWRKDSAVMVVHHIITLALISFSYAFRYPFTSLNTAGDRDFLSSTSCCVIVSYTRVCVCV